MQRFNRKRRKRRKRQKQQKTNDDEVDDDNNIKLTDEQKLTAGKLQAYEKKIQTLENQLKEQTEKLKSSAETEALLIKYNERHYEEFETKHKNSSTIIQDLIKLDEFKNSPLQGLEAIETLEHYGQEYSKTISKNPTNTPIKTGGGSSKENKTDVKSAANRLLSYIKPKRKGD